MAGLQRRILAIVGETEQLAGGVLEIGLPAQVAHGEEAGDRSSRAAPLRTERGQLAEIGSLARTIRNAAVQAEAERSLEVVAWQATYLLLTSRTHPNRLRQPLPQVAAHAQATPVLFQPILRQPGHHLLFLARPGADTIIVDKPRLGILTLFAVRKLAPREPRAPAARCAGPAHAVILLAALPAENQRQQYPIPVPWHELLPLHGKVTLLLRLQRGIDGITATDELVQAEGEGWLLALGIAHAAVAGKQALAHRDGAPLRRDTGGLVQGLGGTVRPANTARRGPDQPPAARLRLYTEGALDPPR